MPECLIPGSRYSSTAGTDTSSVKAACAAGSRSDFSFFLSFLSLVFSLFFFSFHGPTPPLHSLLLSLSLSLALSLSHTISGR